MNKVITSIEGIGAKTGALLRAANIITVPDLLSAAGTKKGRSVLSKQVGISESVLLKCVNMADLFRINGVASQYAELLEGAGVDTVKELKHRNADNLAAKMKEVNDAKNLVRRVPALSMVSNWIEQAKKLPAAVSH